MKSKARKSCPNCQRMQANLNAQQAELDAQKRRIEALEATVARLLEQLAAARKNSATSSKPPSSDIVKPPKPPPPMVRLDARSVANPDTRSTSGSRSRPRLSTPGLSIIASIFVPDAAMGWNPRSGASPV